MGRSALRSLTPCPPYLDSSCQGAKGVGFCQFLLHARACDGSRAVRVRPAVVSPASGWSVGSSGPGWEVARQGANRYPRPVEGPRGTSAYPQTLVLPGVPFVDSSRQCVAGRCFSPYLEVFLRRRLGWVGGLVSPHSADDTRHLVGQGHGGLVVAARGLEVQDPGAQAVGLFGAFGGQQHGAGAVNQEHPQIDVTALADASESSCQAAGALTRSEAEKAGEATTGGKALDVADEGHQGGGGEQADAGDRLQALDHRHLGGEQAQLLFHL